jgi:chemotaxis response regulator CheB
MIRTLIVHPVAFVAELKAAALSGEPDIKIVGCVQQVEDALEILKYKSCDVVLASIELNNQGALKQELQIEGQTEAPNVSAHTTPT